MRFGLLGYGSAGKRHWRNLRALRPDATIHVYDPLIPSPGWDNWQEFLLCYEGELDAAIIASPSEMHAAQMDALPCPFFCEKPLLQPKQIGGFVSSTLPRVISQPCAVNFQYRFSPSIPLITARLHLGSRLAFIARDNLLARYGRDVSGIMGAHAFALACWLLGNPASVRLKSDGVKLVGTIEHERGTSSYDIDMDAGARVSECAVDDWPVPLTCGDDVYVDALRAWLGWVEGGARDQRTATLAAGLAVAHIMADVMYVKEF